MTNTEIRPDDFEAILVSEVETLLQGEKHLTVIYARLRGEPQLREFFLHELAAFQKRATRLYAVLCPEEMSGSVEAAFCHPIMRPAA
jgi:hypothetical protein